MGAIRENMEADTQEKLRIVASARRKRRGGRHARRPVRTMSPGFGVKIAPRRKKKKKKKTPLAGAVKPLRARLVIYTGTSELGKCVQERPSCPLKNRPTRAEGTFGGSAC